MSREKAGDNPETRPLDEDEHVVAAWVEGGEYAVLYALVHVKGTSRYEVRGLQQEQMPGYLLHCFPVFEQANKVVTRAARSILYRPGRPTWE